MKFLIVFACALAAASAGHLVEPVYPGAQHLPVIGPNGVPVDTPAVQHATASHLAHKVEAHARNGDYIAPVAPVAPVYPAHPVHQAYATSVGAPAVTAHGVPLETPEVVAAKSAHFAAHGEALARVSQGYEQAYEHPYGHAYGHYVAKRGIYTPYAYSAPAYSYGAYGHHYLAKRGVYAAPLAYSAPAYSYAGYSHFLAKRDVYSPFAYSHGYTHAYPYAHYY